MTADALRTRTRKELETMARRDRVAGWHDMNKEELVHALLKNFHSRRPVRDAESPSSPRSRSERNTRQGHSTPTATPRSAARRTSESRDRPDGELTNGAKRRKRTSDGSRGEPLPEIISERQATIQDSMTAEGYDARWIHVNWTISAGTQERAKVSLGAHWRSAVPVLRIFDVSGDEERGTTRLRSGDVPIDLDEGHWFVRNSQPGRRCVVEIGYRTPSGQFHTLLHSSPVTLPTDRVGGRGERNGFAGLHGSSKNGAEAAPRRSADDLIPKSVSAARHAAESKASEAPHDSVSADWRLHMQAELHLTGRTHPRAEVRALHKKVPLNADGRFNLRVPLENGRLVLPAEVVSPDGSEQCMTIVAVEFNVRHLEPQVFDETVD